jgi:ATP-dependent RNA helicase DHX37/DHR1
MRRPHGQAMQEIHKLRAQISNIASANFTPVASPAATKLGKQGVVAPAAKSIEGPLFNPKLEPPNSTQLKVLRQLMASAFIDQLAVRKDLLDPASKTAGAKFSSTRGVPYRAMGVDEDVFIHPSSVMFHSEPPEWLVWGDIVRTSQVWMKSASASNLEREGSSR